MSVHAERTRPSMYARRQSRECLVRSDLVPHNVKRERDDLYLTNCSCFVMICWCEANLKKQHVVLHLGVQISLRVSSTFNVNCLHLASDCMYFSEECHSLLFFFMPFSKEPQRGQLGHIQALQVRTELSQAFRLVFLSLFWLRLYRWFGYGLGIFQGLRVTERESGRERYMFVTILLILLITVYKMQ